MKISFSHVKVDRNNRIRVGLETGKFYTGSFKSHRDFVSASNRLGIPEELLQLAMEKFEVSILPQLDVELAELSSLTSTRKTEVNCYFVRSEVGSITSTNSTSYDTFKEALDAAKPGEVIEWQSKQMTCCLDIDLEGDVDMAKALNVLGGILPIPKWYWVSQSGKGIHAIYECCPPYLAEELAAIAGYRFSTNWVNAGIELLTRTRAVNSVNKATKGGSIAATSLQGTGEQKAEFTLDELLYSDIASSNLLLMVCEKFDYDIEPGKRYPHTMCPVNPSERAKGKSDPVVIHDDHVYCYICAADRVYSGHPAPGYFPFSELTGLKKETNIKLCVDNLTHWGHAQYSFINDFKYQKLLYSALLKARHGDDPRISKVFTVNKELGLIRNDGFWTDNDGVMQEVKSGSARITGLPRAQYINDMGKVAIDREMAENLASPSNLSPLGYKPIRLIQGFHMTQLQELPVNKIFAVLPGRLEAFRRPRMLPLSERMDSKESWGTLDEILPGVKSDLLTALIIGRGCSEHRAGLSPMLVISGPTGSAKSSHVDVAAAILGDTVASIAISRDKDRFFNELITGKQKSGFIFFDEFFKNVKNAGYTPIDGMQLLLNFKEGQSAYMIFKGGVPLGHLPMFTWADIEIPEEILTHEQIGRRVYHYQLESTVEWNKPLKEHGILEPNKLRENGNERVIHACNSILSDVVDTYFTCPATDFSIITEDFKINLLKDGDLQAITDTHIKRLFDEVCKLKDVATTYDFEKGYRILDNIDLFQNIQTPEEKGTGKCRALKASDISKKLGLNQPCKVEFLLVKGKIKIRFVSYVNKGICNEQLRKKK